MKIFYLGDRELSSTSYHRAEALRRLGHQVQVYDAKDAFRPQLANKYLNKVHYASGYRLLQGRTYKWLQQQIQIADRPDVVWVNSGEYFGPACVQLLKQYDCPVILYNNDDPTGNRDGRRFDMVVKTIKEYDLCVVRRKESEVEFKEHGAKKVLRVLMSYDEVFHAPFSDAADIPDKFRSDVAFIGTWMRHEERDKFLLHLINNGINVNIWGDRWPKSPLWPALSAHYKGGALAGRDYVAAIQGAKICIGLLSRGNRDLHTRRSVEIPFIGSVLCAERTSEHMEMFAQGEEAVFWDNEQECLEVCANLLTNDSLREKIRLGGMRKVRALEAGNEQVCASIVAQIGVADTRAALIN